MRITNKMMTNNLMSNINKNKGGMSSLEDQYTTGKKIQKPSDDPIIAVRALKLRTNLSELKQYYEKNIPDATSWMDVTESALSTVNDVLKSVNTYCVQGSTDTLTASDRDSIAENLKQLKQQIYQEGNTNYAGRYVFSGYKTDSSLIFTEKTDNLKYNIDQNFSGEDIQIKNKVAGSYSLDDFNDSAVTFDTSPTLTQTYRIQLAYSNLDSTALGSINYSVKDTNGDSVAQNPITNITTTTSTDSSAYTPAADEVNYLYDTGEIIMGADVYAKLSSADDINVTYNKSSFVEGELKPEHYFDCVVTDTSSANQDPVTYTKEDQQIQYEINFNQKLTVNTQGSDSITHDMGRTIDDIINSVTAVTDIEDDITEINKKLTDTSLSSEDKTRYQKMLDQFNTDLDLKKEVMQKAFSNGIQVSDDEQDRVNTAVADLGSRSVRLQLTENRLSTEETDFEDLLSKNEDADVAETYVNLTSAQNIYNASLSATSKVIKNTLLNYL